MRKIISKINSCSNLVLVDLIQVLVLLMQKVSPVTLSQLSQKVAL